MSSVRSDLRYALRGFGRSPMFTAIAIASLGLGLGANTAIFSLLDQVMLRPLPVKEPSKLVYLEDPGANAGRFSGDNSDRLFSYPAYRDIRDGNSVFEGVIGRCPRSINLTYKGQGEYAAAELVSGNFFDVLGVKPVIGRLFAQQDDVTQNGHPVIVIGHGYWQRRFGGNANVIGQAVRVNSTLMTVLGVAPKEFYGVHIGRVTDVYVPLTMKTAVTPTWDMFQNRFAHWIHIMARLKPGISAQQAQASLQPLFKTMTEADLAALPAGEASERLRTGMMKKALLLQPAHNGMPTFREESGKPVQVMMAMVGLVLLIACANVANLLVARALGRQKEVAIRLSMGASRVALMRQFIVESVTLSLLGGGAGLIVASWTSDLLIRSMPGGINASALSPALDARALIFCLLLSLLTGVVFGMFPAFQATRPNVNSVLKNQSGGVIGGFKQIRSRQALVVAQVALSLLLLIGAGLFTRSLVNLKSLDPGFRTSNLVMFTLDASRNGYDRARTHRLYEDIQDRLSQIPGVSSATASDIVLLSGNQSSSTVHVEGYREKPDEDMNPRQQSVLPAYFETLGIPLLQGREFTRQDRFGARKVAVVNESFAKQYFGADGALGRHIGFGSERIRLILRSSAS